MQTKINRVNRIFICVVVNSLFFACPRFLRAEQNLPVNEFLGVRRSVFYSAEDRQLKIEVKNDHLIHLEYSDRLHAADPEEPIFTTPMVAKRIFRGPTKFQFDGNVIETSEARLTVLYPSLCVRMFDVKQNHELGEVCAEDLGQSEKQIVIHPNEMENIYGVGNYFYDSQSADGDWAGRDWKSAEQGNARYGFLGGAPSMSQFPMIYALGRGFKNLGMFLDHPYRISWDFRNNHKWTARTWGDRLRLFLFFGPTLPHLRREYMDLVGKPLVPPKDIFGLWVSKFGYSSWKEIQSDLQSLRANGFPVDGFALDLQWFGGTFSDPTRARMGTLSFDVSHFPDPEKVIHDLMHHDKVQIMTIEESYVDERTPEYSILKGDSTENCLLARTNESGCDPVRFGSDSNPMWWGRGGMIDWTHPRAGASWHQMKRMPLARLGIHRHWTDLGEPEMYNSSAHYHGIEPGKNRHADIHNLYNFKWLESIYQGYLNPTDQTELIQKLGLTSPPRFFTMSRSGAPGIQRFGAGMWSGDIAKNAGSLRAHLNSQMHLSLAGIDYYNSDVGGFISSEDGKESGHNDDELYTQWFANSSLGEIPLRPHTWAYGMDDMSVSPERKGDPNSNRFNLLQRYSLSPYLYSLAHLAHQYGEPIFPPLVYYFQDDPQVRKIGNVKMIGNSLLFGVAVGFGQKERKVYLPQGRWVNYHSLDWHQSSGEETLPIPLSTLDSNRRPVFTLPLFAKAGAIIPKMPVSSKTLNISGETQDGEVPQSRVIEFFADETPSAFDWTEDDGQSLEYLQGKFRTTHLKQKLSQINSTRWYEFIQLERPTGKYTGAPVKRKLQLDLIVDHLSANKVVLDSRVLQECSSQVDNCWSQKGTNRIEIFMPLLDVDSSHEVQIYLQNGLSGKMTQSSR